MAHPPLGWGPEVPAVSGLHHPLAHVVPESRECRMGRLGGGGCLCISQLSTEVVRVSCVCMCAPKNSTDSPAGPRGSEPRLCAVGENLTARGFLSALSAPGGAQAGKVLMC